MRKLYESFIKLKEFQKQSLWLSTHQRVQCFRGDGSLYLQLAIPTGRQTYRAVTVKLILLLSNDQKTKNVIKFYQDFLFQHILIYIILYWGKEDFLKKAHFAPKWLFLQKITGFREKLWTLKLSAIIKHMFLVKNKNSNIVCGLWYYVYRSVDQ